MTKERDYAYEALAEVTGSDMNAARGELNSALKSIREQSEVMDSYLLADQIHTRSKLYRSLMPDAMLTPSALAKHWKRVWEEASRVKPKTTNAHASPSECQTCDGDRFVVVNLRSAGEKGVTGANFEEYAPCPDCNHQDPTFYRFDGTRASPPDPAKVREMMDR